MSDSKELKPVSYRLDDKTKEKFKQISAEIGGNQQETMNVLMNAYYLQTKQNGLEEFSGTIDQFQSYITSIITMYTNSLQANHDMKASVMQEFEALLQSKDTTIQDLQVRLTAAKQLKDDASMNARTYAAEIDRLNEYIESTQEEYKSKMADMQSMLADKESLNRALTDSCNELKSKVDSMTAEHNEIDELRGKIDDLTTTNNSLKQSVDRIKAEAQITLDKTILEIESKYREQIQSLKEQKQAEIDRYQQKYLELLEQLKNN